MHVHTCAMLKLPFKHSRKLIIIIECVGEDSSEASIPFLQTFLLLLCLQRKGYPFNRFNGQNSKCVNCSSCLRTFLCISLSTNRENKLKFSHNWSSLNNTVDFTNPVFISLSPFTTHLQPQIERNPFKLKVFLV